MELQIIRTRLIRYTAGRTYLQAAGLIERLMRDEQTDFLSVTRALKQLADAGDIVAAQWANGVPLGRVIVKAISTLVPTEIRWRNVLANAGLSDEDVEALAPCHLAVYEWGEADMDTLAKWLLALRAERPTAHAYNASVQARNCGAHREPTRVRNCLDGVQKPTGGASADLRIRP